MVSPYIYANDVKGTALWRHEYPLFLDVVASFSSKILKRLESFSRLDIISIMFALNWMLFSNAIFLID